MSVIAILWRLHNAMLRLGYSRHAFTAAEFTRAQRASAVCR
ncbi:hypothetical protein Y026_5500 [Burkholderia pseudomallei TSV28]|nr:hypothetical protein Y026_5500 [Burkholderia pseudomallei TSV28]